MANTSLSKGDIHTVPGNALRGEATYNALLQAILSCTLAPGSTLTEISVMEQYQVGKSTCRLALRIFSAARAVPAL